MNLNMSEMISGVTLTKACGISPDNESKKEGVTKKINVKVKFDGATLQGVFDKALASTVIQWQNGVGRKQFDTLKDNQTVEITFTSPAKTTVDPMESIIASAKAAGMTVEEYVISEMRKRM